MSRKLKRIKSPLDEEKCVGASEVEGALFRACHEAVVTGKTNLAEAYLGLLERLDDLKNRPLTYLQALELLQAERYGVDLVDLPSRMSEEELLEMETLIKRIEEGDGQC